MSVGLTSRLLDARSGRQFIAGTFGQTYYFEIPRVTLPGETPITASHSDLVAQVSIAAFEDWSADAGVQWDPQHQRSERTTVNVQYKPAPNALINLAYRYERFTTTTELVAANGGQQLVPIPVQRGYDQIAALVEVVAKRSHRQVWSCLRRSRYTESQTRLSRKERLQNLRNAFELRKGTSVLGKRLLLVDDVLTTGSTLDECARILKAHGAKSVRAITVARR